MNKVLIFLDSGQTIETYLNNVVTNMITEEIKNIITGKEVSKTIWVDTNNKPELIVPTKNIVAVKIMWNVREKNNG